MSLLEYIHTMSRYIVYLVRYITIPFDIVTLKRSSLLSHIRVSWRLFLHLHFEMYSFTSLVYSVWYFWMHLDGPPCLFLGCSWMYLLTFDSRSGRNLKQMECSLNIDRKMFWELLTDKLR